VAGEAQRRSMTAKTSGWGCRGTPSGPQPSKYNQRNRGSRRAWHTPRWAEASARTHKDMGLKCGYMLGDRRKTTKKLKPNSLQSLNRLPPHKQLWGGGEWGFGFGPGHGSPGPHASLKPSAGTTPASATGRPDRCHGHGTPGPPAEVIGMGP